MNRFRFKLLFIASLVVMGGCATMPPGPSVMVMPPPGKPFEVFKADDASCRQWAETQSGWQANETVNQNLAGGAAIGTVLGTGLGAIIGSAYGNVGAGAAIGAASGLALGVAGASGPAQAAGYEVQRRYDIAYQQCMYSKGNQISNTAYGRRVFYVTPPPPPPPGYEVVPPPPPPPY